MCLKSVNVLSPRRHLSVSEKFKKDQVNESRGFSRVYARFIYDQEKKKNFHQLSAIVGISVGQQAHEGEKLKATINLANKCFHSVSVAVCDTLQRHTMRIGTEFSAEEMYEESRFNGVRWLARNLDNIYRINPDIKIWRWDEWLFRDDFQEKKALLNELYHTDPIYKEKMDSTIKDFEVRFSKRGTLDSSNQIRYASYEYLIEECAIIMMMWKEYDYNYIIYPSKILAIMEATHAKFSKREDKEMLEWLRIKLKTKYIANSQEELCLA